MGFYFGRASKCLPPPPQFGGPLFGPPTVGPTIFFFLSSVPDLCCTSFPDLAAPDPAAAATTATPPTALAAAAGLPATAPPPPRIRRWRLLLAGRGRGEVAVVRVLPSAFAPPETHLHHIIPTPSSTLLEEAASFGTPAAPAPAAMEAPEAVVAAAATPAAPDLAHAGMAFEDKPAVRASRLARAPRLSRSEKMEWKVEGEGALPQRARGEGEGGGNGW
ncbi:testis-specific gene A8 protein-like [Panicum virgatum]|uniref:testis-specific gene A8 protein-like n=1 Tax=Panicum virgatum TaxID=38727 RepID=UPI0019D55E2A|nr:testis-specific gene A8 protein-like [Panicum virgatum]